MIVHPPEIIRKDGRAIMQARIETADKAAGLPDTLWFAYPERYENSLSLRADPFIAPMLQVAMTLHEDLEIRGEASPRLVYGLYEFQKILHHLKPEQFHRIDIHPTALTPAPRADACEQFACGFSGGIDSFFTLMQEHSAGRLTHGLYLFGCADIPRIHEESYTRTAERYSLIFQEMGIELISIDTNVIHFGAYRIDIRYFLEAPVLGAALGLSPLLSGLYMATGGYNRFTHHLTGPLVLPHLRTEQFVSMASGTAYNRFEKTMALADWNAPQKNLRICMDFPIKGDALNCSKCSKCLRTRLSLHALGKLDQFTVLKQGFSIKDYLVWGRWLEPSFYADIVKYIFRHRKDLVPLTLLSLVIGSIRNFLRSILPQPLLNWIYKIVSPTSLHDLYIADHIIEESRIEKSS